MGLMKRLLEERTNRNRAFSKSWEGPFDIEIREDGITHRYNRSLDTESLEKFNTAIQAWGNKVRSALPGSISNQGIKGRKLGRSIKNTYHYDYGEIYRIGFAFNREGIFVHKGVGRGYKMSGGTVVKTSKTQGFNRQPKPWFNPVIESYFSELEEIIKSYTETAIINSSQIYIH
jgi:hypothetical protein